jgi:HEAT repeat protein
VKVTGALSLGAVVAFSLALPAHGDTMLQLTQPVIDTLTPIDSVPSSQQIDTLFNDDHTVALTNLQQIANPTGSVDRGVQLRAIRALIHYCATTPCDPADPAHVTLRDIASNPSYRNSRSGSDLLVLRAAIESLGILQVPGDRTLLEDQLQHPSRDIRAAVARALRDLGNTQAIPALRARYNVEPAGPPGDQVRIAISDALRVLGQPL